MHIYVALGTGFMRDGFYEGQITCDEIVFVHAGTVLSTPRF